jgi:hypothetical protein
MDHIKPIKRKHYYNRKTKKWVYTKHNKNPENDNIDNMLPSCAPCNLWKHDMSLEEFRKSVYLQAEKLYKKSPGFRLLFRFDIISYNDKSIKFYFETLTKK